MVRLPPTYRDVNLPVGGGWWVAFTLQDVNPDFRCETHPPNPPPTLHRDELPRGG